MHRATGPGNGIRLRNEWNWGALASPLEALEPVVLTVTADNGKEFAGHHELTGALDANVYFARPCHSWERGLNEHANGLVRQYFGKSESLLVYTVLPNVSNKLDLRDLPILAEQGPYPASRLPSRGPDGTLRPPR